MRSLVLPFALAGCTSGTQPSCDELAEWTVEVSRANGAPREGAEGAAGRAPDGTIYVAMHDPFDDILFGTQELKEAHLAHVDESGAVLDVVRAPEGDTSHTASNLVVSDDGTQIIVQWSTGPDSLIAAYDPTLKVRWTRMLPGVSFYSVLDVGPSGEVFAVSNTSATSPMIYLAADGGVRWQAPVADGDFVIATRLADNGDVFAFMNGVRRRLAAVDGAVLAELPIERLQFGSSDVSNGGSLLRRDGSYVSAGYAPDGSARAIVTSYDSSAQQEWSVDLRVASFNYPLLATNGDVVAMARIAGSDAFELVSFDAATGTIGRGVTMCGYVDVFSVDPDHYYGLGRPGSASVGLARFANH